MATEPLYLQEAASPTETPAQRNAAQVWRSWARRAIHNASVVNSAVGTSVSTKCDSRTCPGITAIRPAAMSATGLPQRRAATNVRATVAAPASAVNCLPARYISDAEI